MVGDEVEPELKPLNPTRKSFCIHASVFHILSELLILILFISIFALSPALSPSLEVNSNFFYRSRSHSLSSLLGEMSMAKDKIVTERSCTKKLSISLVFLLNWCAIATTINTTSIKFLYTTKLLILAQATPRTQWSEITSERFIEIWWIAHLPELDSRDKTDEHQKRSR